MSWKWIKFILLAGFSLIWITGFTPHSKKSGPIPKTKSELGKLLFSDTILSSDHSVSCASCHKSSHAFADSVPFSTGVGGKLTRRNTPSVTNMLARNVYFWDGRINTLEEQALQPIQNPDEMNLPLGEAIIRLNNDKNYHAWFNKIFNSDPNEKNLGEAIAAYEQTLETAHSRFDKHLNGKGNFLTGPELHGREIFLDKGKCFDCHFTPDFTADEFKNIGLYNGINLDDAGRFEVTHDSSDLGKFKVPGLRNIAITAPYMHNGMFKTLREVIEYYNNPDSTINNSINRDKESIQQLHLTEQEKNDLEAFLRSLTDEQYEK